MGCKYAIEIDHISTLTLGGRAEPWVMESTTSLWRLQTQRPKLARYFNFYVCYEKDCELEQV